MDEIRRAWEAAGIALSKEEADRQMRSFGRAWRRVGKGKALSLLTKKQRKRRLQRMARRVTRRRG